MLFRRNKQPKRELALGIDLGSSQIKAAVKSDSIGKSWNWLSARYVRFPAGLAKSYKEPEFTAEFQQLVEV